MQSLLIVDDDPAIREIFTIILREHGYTVESAASAQECLDDLARRNPDLILLDIMMYPVDGWETLTTIRKNPGTSGIPVIMFSGKNPSRAEILQYGEWIEDYLMKPITMKVINNALKDVFDRTRVSKAERDLFLQNGGDPRMVE
jgi:CheY-like chemotaxis protein